MCGFALVCIGLWMRLSRDTLFYGVLIFDNPTSPFVILSRLALAVLGIGCVVATMCFVGGCGAATECICFLVSVSVKLHLRDTCVNHGEMGDASPKIFFRPLDPLLDLCPWTPLGDFRPPGYLPFASIHPSPQSYRAIDVTAKRQTDKQMGVYFSLFVCLFFCLCLRWSL